MWKLRNLRNLVTASFRHTADALNIPAFHITQRAKEHSRLSRNSKSSPPPRTSIRDNLFTRTQLSPTMRRLSGQRRTSNTLSRISLQYRCIEPHQEQMRATENHLHVNWEQTREIRERPPYRPATQNGIEWSTNVRRNKIRLTNADLHEMRPVRGTECDISNLPPHPTWHAEHNHHVLRRGTPLPGP
jgi:hypothetical protein